MIAAIAFSPTPLMAPMPKRTWPFTASRASPGPYTTLKSAWERFTSGGRTSTPTLPLVKRTFLQSSTYWIQSLTFCAPLSNVRNAAMYWFGKYVFRYAVWYATIA